MGSPSIKSDDGQREMDYRIDHFGSDFWYRQMSMRLQLVF
jgi:hypothetical protein